MIRVVLKLMFAVALCALAAPALAGAASPNQIIDDCNQDGELNGNYSNGDLRKAKQNLPADIDEYSECKELIGAAITSGSDRGRGRGTGAGSGSAAKAATAAAAAKERSAAKADAAALADIARGKKPELQVGGQTVEPGDNGLFDLASAAHNVPLPLLLALLAALLLAVVGALVALRERYPALARIPLLSKINLPRVALPRFRR